MRKGFAVVSAALAVSALAAGRAEAVQGYKYFVVGNPADVVTPTSGLLVLQGGGTDVDENFVRMGARSGGGLCGCDSVETTEVLSTPTHPTPYVYFLRTPGPPEVCQPKTPLTYRNVAVYRIGPGGKFDLDTWHGVGGIAYTLTAEAGVLTSSRGEIY
jgi:hypothetical protein